MTHRTILIFVGVMLVSTGVLAKEFARGETLQLLTNLHPDINKRVINTTNYQLPNLIPMCAE